MPSIGVKTDVERLQTRWIWGAVGIAFFIHLAGAGMLGWYRIPSMEVPFNHHAATGPFTVKRIEIERCEVRPLSECLGDLAPRVFMESGDAQLGCFP